MEQVFCHPLSEELPELTACCAGHSGDRTEIYKEVGNEALRMSWFFPPEYTPLGRYPGVLLVHGGGWQGRKIFADQETWAGDHLGFLARHFADCGYIAVSIDYRLARDIAQTPGYQLMELYEDCVDAVRHIAAQAAKVGLDTERVAVLGESAGGHLAAALLTFPFQSIPLAFRAGILVNAITELSGNWQKAVPLQTDHPLLRDLTIDARKAALSPLSHISKTVCPLMLLHGDKDGCVPPEQSLRFHQAMLANGRRSELHWLADTDHAFLLAEYTKQLTSAYVAIKLIDAYLERELRG